MPPHVASPSRLLRAELAGRRRALDKEEVQVRCAGDGHRVRFDGSRCYAPDHDEAAEAALLALGGPEPDCLRIVAAVEAATPGDLWATLDPRMPGPARHHQSLRLLPERARRVLFAAALETEFVGAAAPVRDSVAQLGLAVLGAGPLQVDALRTKFQLCREFPSWDPGPGPWSDKELVLLARCMRATPDEARPHLVLLPSEHLARQAVAKYAASLLDPERFLSVSELRAALSPTFRNVRALTALLVAEGRLVDVGGQYRVRTPAVKGRPARRR